MPKLSCPYAGAHSNVADSNSRDLRNVTARSDKLASDPKLLHEGPEVRSARLIEGEITSHYKVHLRN